MKVDLLVGDHTGSFTIEDKESNESQLLLSFTVNMPISAFL